MAFRSVGTPMDEMKLLERMRARDPVSAANVVANGKLFVSFAQQGSLRAIQCTLEHMQEDHVPLFYSVRMFRVACDSGRLDILRFMLAHGFDMDQVGVRDVLHCAVEAVRDEYSAETAQPLIRFLLEAGVDVNWQRPSDLFTALHIACRKNLYGIAYLLIIYGADVNAIAMNDEMPLTCAEAQAPTAESRSAVDAEQNRLLISLLVEHNAQRTWRKSKTQPTTARTAMTQSVSLTVTATATVTGAPPPPLMQRRAIVSFSSSFSAAQQQMSEDLLERQPGPSHEAVGAVTDAFASGIMLDTPE